MSDADFPPDPDPAPREGPLQDSSLRTAAASVSRALGTSPDAVTVSLLYQGQLRDSTRIFLVQDAEGQAIGVVHFSSRAAPGMVARGMARARIAAAGLASPLNRAVLLPIAEGEIDGQSYAVMPHCRSFSGRRWRWALERLLLRPVVFRWLHGVAETTLQPVTALDLAQRFQRPLEGVLALEGASALLTTCTRRALTRLASGAWKPRHVLMHGDLWKGNLLLRGEKGLRSWSERLAVIDWAGAQQRGYAFFDLVRAADSLRVRPAALQAEVARHCAVLGCKRVDATSYVLAAVGAILGEIGEFPLDRLLAMAEDAVRSVEEAEPPPAIR